MHRVDGGSGIIVFQSSLAFHGARHGEPGALSLPAWECECCLQENVAVRLVICHGQIKACKPLSDVRGQGVLLGQEC